MRIYRLQTTDGERAIGRLVTQDQLITVYARLGLDCELQMDSDEVFCAVMDKRRTLSLVNERAFENLRDPLGIDRAVNDYYFPNGVPAGGPDSIETAQELIDPIAPSGMDTQS